jgi:lipopolysaccharide transport system ATP-binding protein
MPDTVIRAEHVAKRYRIGEARAGYKTLREALVSAVGAPARRIRHGVQLPSEFWALDDVSFEVTRGQAVGIIGRNGAGKSTLLKILSRITRPTRGRVDLYGRVSALLEVGTGFHGELTGRENIYLNGAILGMRRREIEGKFDQIVDFAGIGQFLDTPVKYYSSGMYVRLAFAVAAHLEPEILVVDEVLAVGDAEFQKKCLNKMGSAAGEGRTVLFVSHNMSAIQDLCSTAIWLDAGRIVQAGDARSTVAAYLSNKGQELRERHWEDLASAPGNETVRVVSARVQAEAGHDAQYWTVETPLELTFRIFNFRQDLPLYLNFHVYNQQGVCVFNTASTRAVQPRGIVEGRCRIPGNLLNDDTYSVKFMAHYRGTFGVIVDDALVFEINDIGRDGIDYYGKWSGVTRPRLDWQVRWVAEGAAADQGPTE